MAIFNHTSNITRFPMDFMRYANDVSDGLFMHFVLIGTFFIIYMSVSGFDIKPKDRFATAGVVTGLLSILAFLGGLETLLGLFIGLGLFVVSFAMLVMGRGN